ncbi:MAG TPA: hypothetical protein VMU36_02875 [Spirochaetia bacterium]|nr:hypothetical protein [Spirochaetia bacterium]
MKEKKTGDYVGAVVANIIVLVFVNTLLLWRQSTQGIVLESWADVLWALDISLGAQIFGNLLLCFYRPPWFSALIRAFLAAAGLMSIIVFYIVFPLDFSHAVGAWLNTLLKVVLIVGMAGSVIGLVIELVRFIRAAGRAASGRS